MEALLVYLLKSAAIISIFFAVYIFLLRNDTGFTMNRIFLLLGIFTSFLLPAMVFTRIKLIEAPAMSGIPDITALQEPLVAQGTGFSPNWWMLAGITYSVIAGGLVLRLLIRLLSLRKFLLKTERRTDNGYVFISTRQNITAFSFFKIIVYNPQAGSPGELEMILKHEKVHASQWHSIDVLIAHLASAVLWFNPLMWLYKDHLLQNLEYLADRETAGVATSTKEYQKTLLRISAGDLQPLLANHFHQSLIKKRIIMLNKKTTSGKNAWKTGIVLPFLLTFIVGFQVRTEARIINGEQSLKDSIEMKSEFAVTVNSGATKESLAALTQLFSNRNVSLTFSNVERSIEGKIIRIEASFETAAGQKGNYIQTNLEGITPFSFYTTGNGEAGFRAESANASPAVTASGYGPLEKIGDRPLIIVEDKEYHIEDLYGKYIQLLGGVEVLSFEETAVKLKKKSPDGALLVPKGKIINDFEAAMKSLDAQAGTANYDYLQFKEGMRPSFVNVKKNADTGIGKKKLESSTAVGTATFTKEPAPLNQIWRTGEDRTDIIAIQSSQNSGHQFAASLSQKPLIVVDGKIQKPDFDANSIDPNRIKSINVLNGRNATEKYGEKGQYGVVEITLKQEGDEAEARTEGSEKKNNPTATSINLRSKDTTGRGESKTITITGNARNTSQEIDALYVVDGKIMDPDFNESEIQANDIESITVLKGEKAIEKYGKKASKGVIEITTRKE